MKRFIRIFIFTVLFASGFGGVSAQTWQGLVKYRGYTCHMLGTPENPQVLVGKGTDAGGYEVCNIKFRSPYRWSNTEWANVKIVMIDLHTGTKSTGDSYCYYNDGWIYLSHYFGYPNPVKPYYNYIVTVYKDNDCGASGAQSKTINLHLDKLNTSRLPVSGKAFEKYW